MFLRVSISSIIDLLFFFFPLLHAVQLESQHSAAVASNLGTPVSRSFFISIRSCRRDAQRRHEDVELPPTTETWCFN